MYCVPHQFQGDEEPHGSVHGNQQQIQTTELTQRSASLDSRSRRMLCQGPGGRLQYCPNSGVILLEEQERKILASD